MLINNVCAGTAAGCALSLNNPTSSRTVPPMLGGGASSRAFQTAAADVQRWASVLTSPAAPIHCPAVYPPPAAGALACQPSTLLALHDPLVRHLPPTVLQSFSDASMQTTPHHHASAVSQPAFTVHHAAANRHSAELTDPG